MKMIELTLRRIAPLVLLSSFVCLLGAAPASATDQCSAALPVGTATGCGAVITVTAVDGSGKATAFAVTNTGNGNPYDGPFLPFHDDTLIGIQNNSGVPLNSITLVTSASARDGLFAFDGDGMCAFNTADCFPLNGNSGYEGPNNTFTNISEDERSGTVHFTGGGIPNGGSTFFALEGTPDALTGVTQTGQPIDATAGTNAAQTFTFNDATNNLDQYAFDYSNAALTITDNNVATPSITNSQITPADWPSLVRGTPFATTQCIPVNGAGGNCVAKTQLCTTPSNATPAGDNCPQSNARNILLSATFDPATLIINPNTVFGVVEASDAWLTATTPGGPCAFVPQSPEGNMSCPQNGAVSFTGPGEYTGRKGGASTNSTYVWVTGVLAPSTAVSGFVNAAGWTHSNSDTPVTGTLTANPQLNPNTNSSVVAPIDSITYGISSANSPLPSTLLPVPEDTTVFSPNEPPSDLTSCPNTINSDTQAPSFALPVDLGALAEGSYLLHYSARDCAGTNELSFKLDPDSKVWSTSFKSFTINVDNTLPITGCSGPDLIWHNSDVSIPCSPSDTPSGLAPNTPVNFNLMTAVPSNTDTNSAPTTSRQVCDKADNCVTAGPILGNKVDKKSPDITVIVPAATTYAANQNVLANYGCTDLGAGVTLANCAGPVASGVKIDTMPSGITTPKSFTVNATDSALPTGNSSIRLVNYTVSCHYAAVGISPVQVTRPAFITVTSSVIDCMPAAQTVSVKFTLSGPLGKNCGNSSTVMFTTPPFTIKAGTSKSISFPFPILKNVCAGIYTVTTTTLISGAPVDSTSATLTVQ